MSAEALAGLCIFILTVIGAGMVRLWVFAIRVEKAMWRIDAIEQNFDKLEKRVTRIEARHA